MPLTTGLTTVLGGGAALGILAGGWGHIRLWASRIYGIFVIRAVFKDYATTAAFSKLMMTEFKHPQFIKFRFRGSVDFVRPAEKNQLVVYELVPTEPTYFWRGWRPVLIHTDEWGFSINVSYIRGMYDLDELIKEATTKYNTELDTEQDRFTVRRLQGTVGEGDMAAMMKMGGGGGDNDNPLMCSGMDKIDKVGARPVGYELDEIGQPKPKRPEDAIVLPPEAQEALDELKWWKVNAKWFRDRMLPWKRGWLLHGAAGTGKTSLARITGQVMNMPIFIFDLATMNNRDFCEAWRDMMKQTPCIALMEDIDTVFNGRDNVADTGDAAGLTFDCLLNMIDGVENTDGVLLVLTTNHPDKIDKALGTCSNGIPDRPGRIDRAIEFGPLVADGRRKIAERILGDWTTDEWDDVVAKGNGDSGAKFQERCRRVAMTLLNKQLETNDGT